MVKAYPVRKGVEIEPVVLAALWEREQAAAQDRDCGAGALSIALWRYLTFGEVPAGARMKA